MGDIQKKFVESIQDDEESVTTSFQNQLSHEVENTFPKINKFIELLYEDPNDFTMFESVEKDNRKTIEIHESQIYAGKVPIIF